MALNNEQYFNSYNFNKKALTHYYTLQNNFNYNFYIKTYNLELIGINTEQQAIKHWNEIGKNEGRYCNEEMFDWIFYLNKHEDLRNAGINTYEKALNHWNKYGRNEHRECNDEEKKRLNEMKNIGFIILRYVNNSETNRYWIENYNNIRKYYPENQIMIIDDNSDNKYLTNIELYKTIVICSEFPRRGEILPYYYYLKNKLFDTAVIIHDSVFINKYINFNVEKYKMIWDFYHNYDQIDDEMKMIKIFKDDDLLKFYENKSLWTGCFGAMTVIKYDFLESVNKKYDLTKLFPLITTRYNRCSFERVLACLLQSLEKGETLLGNIFNYSYFGIKYDQKNNYSNLPITKVWTGR